MVKDAVDSILDSLSVSANSLVRWHIIFALTLVVAAQYLPIFLFLCLSENSIKALKYLISNAFYGQSCEKVSDFYVTVIELT